MRFVGNISALCVVAVSHGLDTNPAAVRLFRKRSAKGLDSPFPKRREFAHEEGSAAWAVAFKSGSAEGQAICGFSHREVPPMPPTPEIGAG